MASLTEAEPNRIAPTTAFGQKMNPKSINPKPMTYIVVVNVGKVVSRG